jgi:uncharacterized protein (TIGR03086 family)
VVLDGFVRALDGFEAVLAGVAPLHWSAPSPCAGWSAADVAGHVIGDLRETEALARGRYTGTRADDPGSAAGDDPLAAWRAARADMMATLDPAALALPVPGPWGQMPLGEILERSPMEFLVHTWDLAQATGQAVVLDPGLVRDALEPARQFTQLARLSGLVGPECAVAEDADDLTRLLAIFGRRNTSRLRALGLMGDLPINSWASRLVSIAADVWVRSRRASAVVRIRPHSCCGHRPVSLPR